MAGEERGRLHFNHQRRRLGARRECRARTGVFRINWYPPPTPHAMMIPILIVYRLPHVLQYTVRRVLPWPPAHTVRVGFGGKKKRAGIFLSIPPGSLFFPFFIFIFFFLYPSVTPLTLLPGGVRVFFPLTSTPHLHPLPPRHRVQTPRFFFTQDI